MANRPAHEIRLGKIKATLWANETEIGKRYHVIVSRLYKDGDGPWKSTDNFGRDDLALLCKVVDKAHTWIFEQQAEHA